MTIFVMQKYEQIDKMWKIMDNLWNDRFTVIVKWKWKIQSAPKNTPTQSWVLVRAIDVDGEYVDLVVIRLIG